MHHRFWALPPHVQQRMHPWVQDDVRQVGVVLKKKRQVWLCALQPVVSLVIEAKPRVTPERRGQNPHLTPQGPISFGKV
jgi:hypothetical protein